MPIRIEKLETEPRVNIDYLCEDEWELPKQIEALEEWLKSNIDKLEPSEYVADIGYSPREHAASGGAGLSPISMGLMAKIGMYLWFSEYPNFDENN